MANTPNIVLPEISASQLSKNVTHNDSLRIIDALVMCSVISLGDTTPPLLPPPDGSRYVPGASATGVWAGLDNRIVYYKSNAWISIIPTEGWEVYVVDEDLGYRATAAGDWVAVKQASDMSASNEAVLTSSQVIFRRVMARATTFPANFSGSRGSAAVAGTGVTATLSVQKNGATIGTVVYAVAAIVATFTTTGGLAQSFAAGDRLTIVGPATANAALAGIAISLAGSLDGGFV